MRTLIWSCEIGKWTFALELGVETQLDEQHRDENGTLRLLSSERALFWEGESLKEAGLEECTLVAVVSVVMHELKANATRLFCKEVFSNVRLYKA